MPTYDYRCKDCGHELEVVQSFTDDALTTCEQCGGALRKLFGSVGISFKGSGFYKNDSRTSGKSASSESTSADPKPSESTSSDAKSSDSKSADSTSSGTKSADTTSSGTKAPAGSSSTS